MKVVHSFLLPPPPPPFEDPPFRPPPQSHPRGTVPVYLPAAGSGVRQLPGAGEARRPPRFPAVLGRNAAPGKPHGCLELQEPLASQTKPDPDQPPPPSPGTGSLSSPPRSPRLSPLPHRHPRLGGGGLPRRRQLGGALPLPPRCPSRPAGLGRVRGSAHSGGSPRSGAPSRFRGERGHGVLLSAFAFCGLFSSSLLKGGRGKRTPVLEIRFRKLSPQKRAGPVSPPERKRGANSASRGEIKPRSRSSYS